ncbi:hypothetical protein OEZ85_001763 [Tetradesmus obliquus]|uniref:Acyltransferase n=1 Tax=Tetradesmus obliquus TaxID=3088 RepID=A0ABY8U1H1_TETOB|nr:hypothetical protein OEZ85_001763 [Tetradesmus obliquus]
MTAVVGRKRQSALDGFTAALALSVFVGAIFAATVLVLGTAYLVIKQPWSPWTWTLAVLTATLAFVPLWKENGPLGEGFMRYIVSHAEAYFPITVVCDGGATFSRDTSYVIGLEPHSALPTAMPSTFSLQSTLLPDGLRGRTHGLASSICFQIPLVRHLYWWIGIRPITRHSMRRLLHKRRNVVLVPGGVQECLYMQKDCETAFLSKRKGFIRIAMQCGSPVVPCFAFGQGGTYSWYRPGPPLLSEAFVQAASRRMGMVPLALVGRWGTPAPINSPMTVVFGKPIDVPHKEHPTDAELQQYLDKYIAAMQDIFARHKAAAGYPHYRLHIL